ncbi:amidase [Jeotgalibaca sp. A127]|uniref:amidase n=1 Tax=Jeotgalibaca sp. A127 TaxID=3457324 RepID=UPI003FD4D993
MQINREEDALHFAALVRDKKVSPTELVRQTIDKIEKENPSLNAVIHPRFEAALREAETRDFSGKPFGGVPILLKDMGQTLAGEPSTSGSVLLKDYVSAQTSHYTQKLLDAGFVVVGQTNVPEFGFKNITDARIYGSTRNPWNTDYSPGGSSGGAGAAVAAGMVPVAGASDGGGSIRIPASFTGLVGLKPTRGRMPVGPGSGRNWQGASIDFALTKSIRDTVAMVEAMQTVQLAAAFQAPLLPNGFIANGRRKFKVAYSLKSPILSVVSQEAKDAVMKMVDWLEANGHEVVEKDPDYDGVALMKSYYIMNCGETTSMLQGMEQSLGRAFTLDDMELVSWVLYQAGKKVTAAEYSNTLKRWDAAAEAMAIFHEDFDLLLTPTTADAAPRIDTAWQSAELMEKMANVQEFGASEQQQIVWDMFDLSLPITPFGMQANLTGAPALSLPVHLTENGLPLGVQFTAPKGREDWLLALGEAIEADGLFI